MDHVAVIGVGNWGSSLAAGLEAAGIACERVNAPERASAGAIAWQEAKLQARVLWICVPDAAIASVAEELVHRLRQRGAATLRGRIVAHASGALSSEVLKQAAEAGAKTASVHPMMSFPSRRPAPLAEVPFAVETADAGARRRLFALVRKLGGRPFSLPVEGKALYHAAGTMASPLLASLLAASLACLEAAGLERREAMRLLAPMARATVATVFRDGPERSFSGPIARGDVCTVALHLRALAAHPLLDGVYRSLAEAALARLPSAAADRMGKLLSASDGERA